MAPSRKKAQKSSSDREEGPVVEEKEDPKKETRSMLYILAGIGAFVIIIVAIILFSNSSKNAIDTPDEMFAEVAKQGETGFGYTYADYVFINYGGLWLTRIDDQMTGKTYDIPLHFGPRDLEDVSIDGNPFSWIVTTINLTQLYVTFDPRSEEFQYLALAASELAANLHQVIGVDMIMACTTNETEACKDLPAITCENTDMQVILLVDGEDSARITKGENCLILSGKDLDLVKAVDRLLYIWYGVMLPYQSI